MKKLFTILLLPLLFPCLLFAQVEPANYKEAVSQFINQFNQADAESIFNKFNAQMQAALPLEKTRTTMNQIKAQLGDIKSVEFKSFNSSVALYKTTFTNGVFGLKISLDAANKMGGLLVQPFQEEKILTVDANLTETPVDLSLPDASLSGSLLMPKNSIGKIPVVLIIAGSGATDRNGNSAGLINANSYFLLANALGKAGIATLRYDKRAIGKSTSAKSEADTRFDDFVNDASALVKLLKDDPRFSKVIVLGHSEGALIGMVAAEKEKADGYVSVSGAGNKAEKVIAEQLKATPEIYTASVAKLDSLAKGFMVSDAGNLPLFRRSVQPYLISWFKYNPQTELKKLKVPVLIVQGTTDIQVSVADAQNLKKAKPDATLVLVDGMNHALKQAPADRAKNLETYSNPDLPIDPKLVEAVVSFVNQVK
ncbi:alpha/beta fold hydrolase [uncultured Mucilaginibacter sp.]|uniref:alpha/beta fold hydrolase n=1 Tax=uncultured Mucilaginibacter sp. TaxID=797541 RepID=UPI002617E1DF|nr:alpha/beta fold hydrolase [uncultured Mucilaginibacter sp.]